MPRGIGHLFYTLLRAGSRQFWLSVNASMSTERRSCKRPALAATFSSLVGPPQQCSEDAVSKNTSSTADAASQLTIVAASSQYQGPGTTLPTEIDSPSQLFAAASLPESDAARGPFHGLVPGKMGSWLLAQTRLACQLLQHTRNFVGSRVMSRRPRGSLCRDPTVLRLRCLGATLLGGLHGKVDK